MRVFTVFLDQVRAHPSFLAFVDANRHFMVVRGVHLRVIHYLWLSDNVILHAHVVEVDLNGALVSLLASATAFTTIQGPRRSISAFLKVLAP